MIACDAQVLPGPHVGAPGAMVEKNARRSDGRLDFIAIEAERLIDDVDAVVHAELAGAAGARPVLTSSLEVTSHFFTFFARGLDRLFFSLSASWPPFRVVE